MGIHCMVCFSHINSVQNHFCSDKCLPTYTHDAHTEAYPQFEKNLNVSAEFSELPPTPNSMKIHSVASFLLFFCP